MGTQPLWEGSPDTCDELCCAQRLPVNTQMGEGGGTGITASPSTHSSKSREEIPIHNAGGLNITPSLSRGDPRGCPQLLTLVQGLLVECGSQALVTPTPSPGTQIWVQSLQGCTAPVQPISCFWEKGLKAPVVVKCSSLPASHRRARAGREEGGQERWQPGRGSLAVCNLEKNIPDLSPEPSSQ